MRKRYQKVVFHGDGVSRWGNHCPNGLRIRVLVKRALLFSLITLPLWFTPMTEAIIIEYPLSAEGEYSVYQTWTTSFDLGVTFIEISNVNIELMLIQWISRYGPYMDRESF